MPVFSPLPAIIQPDLGEATGVESDVKRKEGQSGKGLLAYTEHNRELRKSNEQNLNN